MVFENITDKTMKEKKMKNWCYEIINNAEFYYQTAFNIAVILGQLSDYNNALKE